MKINPILKQWLKREVDTFRKVYMRRDATALEIAMITGLQHQSLIEIDQIVDNGNSHDYIRYSLTAIGEIVLGATHSNIADKYRVRPSTTGASGYDVVSEADEQVYFRNLPKLEAQEKADRLNGKDRTKRGVAIENETTALRSELAAANAKIAALEAELLESKQYRKLLEATLTSCKQLYDGEQDKLAKLYRENDRLQDRVDDLNNMVDEARIERDSLKAQLAECQHAHELASTQRDAVTEMYSGKHSRLEDVKRELEAKDERITELETVIETVHAQLINAADKIGNHVPGTGYLADAIETIEAELPDID